VEKYLRQYAEQGTAIAEDIPVDEPWQHVLVIPVCNEKTDILRPLPSGRGRSLMILVVNETVDAVRKVSLANREFVEALDARFSLSWKSDFATGLYLYRDTASARDILLVDRFRKGNRLPSKAGVGHARKMGADLAANLVHHGRVRSSWIHCSDADVRLPDRYFSCDPAQEDSAVNDTAALIYPFRHGSFDHESGDERRSDGRDKIIQASLLYEYSLRYYVAGLSFAGSPYAFHTIGSTMAVSAIHYARVRGFPRRQAGEDFYLLNKLAKTGSILQMDPESDCDPIDIQVRHSDRVPFGTGAAVGKIMNLAKPASEFLLYHPGVFDLLRSWLSRLPSFWQAGSEDISGILCGVEVPGSADEVHETPPSGLETLIAGLEVLGAPSALQHAFRQSSDTRQFQRQMHTWFDAFRTLKLIHYLRDHHATSVSFVDLVTKLKPDHLMSFEASLAGLQQELLAGWNKGA
jgi:hypothetical protein